MARTLYTLLIGGILLLPASRSLARHRYQLESQQNARAIVDIRPEPAVSLDYLMAASDLIVLGELVTVDQTSANGTVEVSGNVVKVRVDRGTLRIDEALRGTQESPLVFDLVRPMQYIGWQTPGQQDHGLFFFRVGEDKKITFTDPYNSFIASPRDLQSRGDTALDRVVSILGDMLMRPDRPGGMAFRALPYLQFSKSKAANGVLRTALYTVADPQLSIQIANGLLLQGDRSSLGFLKQVFLTGPKIPMADIQEQILGNVTGMYIKDPEAIPDLEDLLGASSVYVRRGAAGALRRTQSPKALNGLAKALEDEDFKVRYSGVVGLAELTGQKDWQPDESLFKSDEGRFLTHWKEWARNR